MPVFPGSRHQDESKFTRPFQNNQGQVRTVSWLTLRRPLQSKGYPDNTTVVLSEGDALQAISHRLYGDPQYWWVIAEFSNVMDPTSYAKEGGELFPGLVLAVPSMERLFTDILG